MAGLRVPLLWLHPRRYRHQRTTRGQRDWLGLHCRTLSFPTPSRFNPALSLRPIFCPEAQLYNLAEDPYEKNNRINDRPKVVDSLRKRLAEIQSEIRPAGPVGDIPKGTKIYGEEEAKTFKGWDK